MPDTNATKKNISDGWTWTAGRESAHFQHDSDNNFSAVSLMISFFRCWRTEFNEKQKKSWMFVPYIQWPQPHHSFMATADFFGMVLIKSDSICKKGIKKLAASGRYAIAIANGCAWQFLICQLCNLGFTYHWMFDGEIWHKSNNSFINIQNRTKTFIRPKSKWSWASEKENLPRRIRIFQLT